MQLRTEAMKAAGVKVIAPPVRDSRKGQGLGKSDVAIDHDAMVATCPGGVPTGDWKWSKSGTDQVPMFVWSKASDVACGCRETCPAHKPRSQKTGSPRAPFRRLRLHKDERGLRAVRAEWEQPELRARYRRRAEGERLMREVTRRGARRAAAWGLENASLQAHHAAAVSNLLVLAKRLAAREAGLRQAA